MYPDNSQHLLDCELSNAKITTEQTLATVNFFRKNNLRFRRILKPNTTASRSRKKKCRGSRLKDFRDIAAIEIIVETFNANF